MPNKKGKLPLSETHPELAKQAYGWNPEKYKSEGADLSNSKIAGNFDGFSEAWSKSTFPVKSIRELMRLTEEFEEKK